MYWNSEKLKQKGIYVLYKAFSIGISTAEMKKHWRLNYNLICSNTLQLFTFNEINDNAMAVLQCENYQGCMEYGLVVDINQSENNLYMYNSNNDYSIISDSGSMHCQGYGSWVFSHIIFHFDFNDYLNDDYFNLIIVAIAIITMIIIIATITIPMFVTSDGTQKINSLN